MNTQALFDKALRASASAKLLLLDGDADGACNRAYYAMFAAARAALQSAGIQAESARTHSGLIAAFGLHLVKPGQVSLELGRILNRAEEIRLIADYRGDTVEATDAAWVVEQAEQFVAAMHNLFPPAP